MVSGKHGKLRILHVGKTSVGAPWAVRQTRDLVRLGLDVHIAVPAGGPRVAQYEEAGVTVHLLQPDLPIRAPWRVPGRLRALRDLVRRVDPDIIHTLYAGTAVATRIALGRNHPTPRVFQVPGPLHVEHPLYRRAELATAGRHDYWIGTCRSIGVAYRAAGIPDAHVFVCDYGVDLEDHQDQPKGALRAELGVGAATPIIGMVGIMYPPKRYLGQVRGLKGHEDLIDALAICLERRPDALGVFVGGAWGNAAGYESHVRSYARAKCGDRAVFLGMRGDVPMLLPDFDVAVQPSHSEGVAGSAVEAQLLGVPVVATAVGGLPDLVVPGENGWLVPPRDPARLAAAILDALGNPDEARAMGMRGRERARQLFDGKRKSAEVVDIYQRVLTEERSVGCTLIVPSVSSTVS